MRKVAAISAGLTLAAIVGVGAASVASSASDTPVQDSVSDAIPSVFEGSQADTDLVDAKLLDALPNSRLDGSTARLLGRNDVSAYYAVRNADGKVCLLGVNGLSAKQPSASTSCLVPSQFNDTGLPLLSSGPWGTSVAYFAPDAFEGVSITADGSVSDGPDGFSFADWQTAPKEVVIAGTRPDGSAATLDLLSADGTYDLVSPLTSDVSR